MSVGPTSVRGSTVLTHKCCQYMLMRMDDDSSDGHLSQDSNDISDDAATSLGK